MIALFVLGMRTYKYSGRNVPDLVLDFFFHARGAELQRNESGMFRSLLHQLCLADNVIKSDVAAIFAQMTEEQGEFGEKWDWHPKKLRQIFTNSLIKTALRRQVILFVDALDEAGENTAKDLARYFNALASQLLDKKLCAKICISARHHPILSIKISKDIFVERHNRADIQTYVRGKFGEASRALMDVSISPDDCETLAYNIGERAEGIFQWGKSFTSYLACPH